MNRTKMERMKVSASASASASAMVVVLLGSVVLLSFVGQLSSALSVTVNDVECVYEFVFFAGDTVSGNFVVVDHHVFWNSDHPGIDLIVTSPGGNVVHSSKGTSGDKFEFMSPSSGMYEFCFHNSQSALETVSFYIHVGHIPSEHDLAKDEHLDPINVKIAELREALESVTAEQKYLLARDTRHRHKQEKCWQCWINRLLRAPRLCRFHTPRTQSLHSKMGLWLNISLPYTLLRSPSISVLRLSWPTPLTDRTLSSQAADADGSVPFFWGNDSEGHLVLADDAETVKKVCGKSFAPFLKGCFFTSSGGLRSFEHPRNELKPVPRVDSSGQVCGATFKVDAESRKDTTGMHRVGSAANWSENY